MSLLYPDKSALKSQPGKSRSSNDDRVVLEVGDRRFTTLRGTLTGESTYFAARLSSRWDDKQEDGSFFIDSDPNLFEDILTFCRSGTFPLFFDMATECFDYSRYAALLGEARYFGIGRLEKWISEQKYLEAVVIKRAAIAVSDNEKSDKAKTYLNSTRPANAKISVTCTWGSDKVYICPRTIPVHRGEPDKCGQACLQAREAYGGRIWYEDIPVLRIVVLSRELVFNPQVCLSGD